MAPPSMNIRMIKDVLRPKLHGRLSHEAVAPPGLVLVTDTYKNLRQADTR